MMSTAPPDTKTKAKSRRSLLPSLNFGSSSSVSSNSSSSTMSNSSWAPSSASGASSSGAEPDYFATVHVPDTDAPNSGHVRIASPFALTTPLVSTSGARVKGPMGAEANSKDAEPHPWAKLFPDGGMTTALPDGFRMGRLNVPPTPAASASSVPNKPQVSTPLSGIPPELRRNLNLPPRMKAGLSSSASLPLPATSASSNKASASTEDLSKFKALDVDGLAEALAPPSWKQQSKAASAKTEPATPPDVLILDIRPSTSYSMARVASSINICAPSTLLKRPAITVERIEDEMLGSASDRRRFMRWRKGPLKPKPDAKTGPSDQAQLEAVRKRGATISLPEEPGINKIIVLDTDTCRIDGTGNATAGGGGPCLIGVLKKFEAAGFAGELCWLVGGFNKLARSKRARELIDTGAPSKAQDSEIADSADSTQTQCSADVRSKRLPTLKLNGVAASPSFASPSDSDERSSLVQPRGLPMEAFQTQSTVAGWPGQGASPTKDGAPRGPGEPINLNLANRQQNQNGNGSSDSLAAQPGGTSRSAAACANPFFDNIRQNRELQHGITDKIPMDLPPMTEEQVQQLPPFLQKLVHSSDAERAHALAQAFFDVEKAEQNRLIATMQQHSAQSDQDPRSKDFASAQASALQKQSLVTNGRRLDPNSHDFPFSIAAALERGADNRYNNIWTYEHSRVRLSQPRNKHDPGSDYLNGSFVHPPRQFGSKRRYIATQAPLPSTFDAFWTAVWEQNSRVIVMLTREHESGRLQSHPYWLQAEYGDRIRLNKLEEVVLDEAGNRMRSDECNGVLGKDPENEGGTLFPTMPSSASKESSMDKAKTPTTIKRIFLLKNLAEPNSAPRRIVQLQYIAWPDYHIPEMPESLLTLMDIADAAQNAADAQLKGGVARGRSPAAGPMVVHCSAGVGRTGAYIVIDAALDVLRRARRRQKLGQTEEPAAWENNVLATAADGTLDVDMAPVSPPLEERFPRTPRRSLKRELSPTGMDIDSNGSNLGRNLSSPPPMLRSRSSDDDAPTTTTTAHSSAGPATSQQSEGGFSNPFTSATFTFNAIGSAAQSPPRNGNAAMLASEAWRQAASSPFSEVSTPSLHSGGSARSSFSSATGTGVHSRLSSNNAYGEASRGIEDALLSAMNPFELAIAQQHTAAVGDVSTSTVTGSNELTPAGTDGLGGSGMSASNSSGSNASAEEEEPKHQTLIAGNPAKLNRDAVLAPMGERNAEEQEARAKEVVDRAYREGEDLIRKVVDTVREQRMSLIQTGRQFVFVYSAVLAGLLRDLRREGVE